LAGAAGFEPANAGTKIPGPLPRSTELHRPLWMPTTSNNSLPCQAKRSEHASGHRITATLPLHDCLFTRQYSGDIYPSCTGQKLLTDEHAGISRPHIPSKLDQRETASTHTCDKRQAMLARLTDLLDAWIGVKSASEFDEALVRERLIAIKDQMPWMHGMLLASLAGIVVALPPKTPLSIFSAAVLFAILLTRAPYMVRIRPADVSGQSARGELRRTFLVASCYFLVSLMWQLSLYFALPPNEGCDVAMFAGIAALGAAAALSSFSPAARIPLVIGAFPFAVLLTVGGRPADQAVGFTLIVVIALRLRLLNVQNRVFERLVRTRFALEIEKRRAIQAEQDAIN